MCRNGSNPSFLHHKENGAIWLSSVLNAQLVTDATS